VSVQHLEYESHGLTYKQPSIQVVGNGSVEPRAEEKGVDSQIYETRLPWLGW